MDEQACASILRNRRAGAQFVLPVKPAEQSDYWGAFAGSRCARIAFLALTLSRILRNWETQAMLLITMIAIAKPTTESLGIVRLHFSEQ